MENINIFDKVDVEETKNYFKFNEVGDKVQGTYVSKQESIDTYNNPQTLVGLKQADGTIITVSVRHNKIGLLNELNKASLGQVIGFVFTGTKENPGRQPTKFIRLVQDPQYTDKEWLAEQAKKNDITAGMTPQDLFPDAPAVTSTVAAAPAQTTEPVAAPAPVDMPAGTPVATPVTPTPVETPAAPTMGDSEKIKAIAELAKEKFGASTAEEVKAEVMKNTNLEFTIPNLDIILEKMKSL